MKHKLSAKKVVNQSKPGLLNDGGGLYLKTKDSGSKSWVFRWRDRTKGNIRAMGLGGFPDVTLSEARDAATAARKVVESGLSPILERDKALQEVQAQAHAEEQAAANVVLFDKAAETFITEKLEPECKSSKTSKTIPQWRSSLKQYASPHIGAMDVADIGVDDVLRVLRPIWHEIPETASRVRMRLERIISWSIVKGYRTERFNPAVWKNNLDALLPSKAKIAPVQHFPALPYAKIPKLYKSLCEKSSLSAYALRWTLLNAVRTSETTGAEWKELETGTWVIPGKRTKTGKAHSIPLSSEAVKLLDQLDDSGKYLFPGGNYGKRGGHMSNMAQLNLLKELAPGVTTHGTARSGFRDWAAECTHVENFVVEMALGHVVGGVEGAYRRGQLLEKRAALMEQWAQYLTG